MKREDIPRLTFLNEKYERLMKRKDEIDDEEFLTNVSLKISGWDNDLQERRFKELIRDFFKTEGKKFLLDKFKEYVIRELNDTKNSLKAYSVEIEEEDGIEEEEEEKKKEAE